MSDDNDLKPSLCTTEDEFERFQSASMYQEDEYITLSDILPPEPKLPDYNDISQIPYDNEVVLSTADDEGASKRNEDDLPSLPIEIPASEVNQDFTKSVQNVANDPITQQPKKRGRKKKTIPENNTSVIGDNDQNTLNSLETNANGIAEQASTTKRGRIIKKPVPYEITPVKTKRGRGRNVSSLNNQSLSAADSTTLDNVASSEPSNPETDETNKQPVLDSIQPGKRRRGRAKKNNSSELNDSSLTHVSISEPQTLENIEIGDTSSNSPKKRGRKRTKLNEMKVEPNSLPDTLDTGIRTNDDLDDIPLLSQVKNIPDGSTETALPDQSHVPIVDSEITLSQNLRSSEPNLNKTLKKPPTKRGRKSRIATIPQKPFDTEIKLEETYDDDETDDLCLSKLKETLDTSDLKIKEHDINIEEHDLVPPNQFDNYEISNGNLGNDISDRNITDHNEIKQESSKQGVSPLKRNTKMPHMSDFEYNIDSIVGSDPNSNENNVDDIDGTSKRRRKAKQMPHNYHEESDEDPFANVELSDDEPKKHRKGTKYYSDDEYVPEMSLKTGKRRKSSDSSDSDMLEDELNDSKRKKMVFKHANRVGEQVDDIEEVLQSSVITASTPSAWGTSSEFENFIAKKIQGTDLKIKKVSESTEHKAPLEIPVLLPEKRMIEMCSQTNIIHTSSVAVQTSSNQEIIIKDNKTLTKEQSVKACEFLNDIVKTTAELGQLMTEKSQDFMKKKIHTDHVTDTIKMDYCVKKSFLLFKLAKHNLMQMEDDLAKQYDTFLKTNNLSSCREKPKVIAAKPKESGDSDCEIVEESPTANKSGKDTKLNPKTVFLNKELSIKIAKKSTTQPPKGAKTTEKKLDIKGRHTVWISDTVMVKKVKPSQSFLAQDSRNKKPPDTFITEQMVSAFFMEYNRQQAFAICAPFVSMDWLNVNNECVCNYFVGQSGDLNNINLSINGTQNITATTTSTSVPNSDNSIMILSNGITSPEPLMTLCYRILNNKLNASKHVEEDPINDVPTDWFKQPATLSQLCLDALNNDHHSVTSLESKSDSAIVIAQIPLSIPPLKTLCYIIVKELFCYVKTSFENISENKTTSEIDDLECFENESYNSDVFDNKCSAHFTKKYCFVETMKENTCTALDAENRIQSLSCMCLNLIQSRKEELSNYSIEISSTQENSSSASPGLDKFEPKSLFSMCVKLIQRKQESYSNQSHGNVNQFNRNIEIVNICRIKSLSSMCLDLIQCKELHLSQEFLEDDNLSQLLEKELFEDKNQLKVHTRYATKNGIKSLFSMCVNQIRNKEIHSCESPLQELTPKTLKCLAFENLKAIFYENWQRPNEPNETVSLCHDTQICNEMPIEGLTINSVNTLSEEAFSNLENIVTDATSDANYEDDFDNDDSNLYEESNPEPDLNTTEEENVHNWVSQVQMKELKSCFNPLAITQEPEGNKATVVNIKTEPVEDPFDNIMDLPAVSSIPTVGINTAVVKTELGPGLDEMTMIPDINQIKPELDSTPADIQRQNSYDGDTFEHFVSSNKMTSTLDEVSNEDIFSQSALRIRRQHEPDLDDENDNIGMSLLIPQTYENMNIETAKGSLMESSSDEGGKNKKSTGKKKVDKKPRGRPKRSEQKVTPNKDAPSTSKERVLPNEVSTLTRKMRERIRQEERQNESSDSDDDNVPLNLRNKKENDKAKSKNSNKAAYPEIQCNSVDSTANVNDQDNIVEKFTGFSSIDQNQTSSYAKLMKYVYDKIIPDENVDKIPEVKVDGTDKSDNGNRRKSKENLETSENSDTPIFAENEPVELLECEPMMPFFDDDLEKTDKTNRSKSIKEKKHSQKSNEPVKYLSHKPTVPVISDNSSKTLKPAKEKKAIPDTKETCANANFVERNGWKCYPVNTNDSKLYQTPSLVLEKLPETFVETYFRYQDITSSKSQDDDEVNRLTNLNTLNRSGKTREKKPHRKGAKGEHTTGKDAEGRSRSASPANSDRYDELTASEDEEAGIDKELPPPVPKHSENILAKDSLMHDNDSDSDGGGKANVKQEHSAESAKSFRPGPRSKTKAGMDPGSLMLTADKMMNKELSLLHAPVSLNEDIETKKSPTKPSNEEEKRRSSQHRSASKHHSSKDNMKNEEDSSSEEEKQWVTTKEKLLKRMGKKEDVSVDDAKRSKLVTDFIERRGDKADSHKKPRGRPVRSRKKFLERQKQLKILSRELFGEPSTDGTHKRSAQAYFKGRRNIRKVIDKKSLARSTVIANMEEFERKKRLNAKQAKLREVMGCEEGVNVLVINDEVCLEYDFEEDRPVVTIHPFFTKVMKAHQYEGVKFMWDACFESLSVMESGHAGGGCILAHCMGLGKTLQVLALLHTVLTHPGVGMRRVLVCCPLSTVLNWVDEIHKWLGPVTNEIKVFELSKLKKTYERAYQLEDWYNGGGIFIIGYELFRSLSTLDPFIDNIRPTIVNKIRTALLDPGPDIIVCDEGHLLKNDCSVLAVAMSRVVTKRRIVLTGTPMQNNLREYYCMVDFVKPNLLGTYSEYSNRFENPIMNGQHRDSSEEDIKLMKARTHILHKVLEGCLQRQEASVLYPYLPKKHEYTVFIPLTKCQWDLYKHYLSSYAKQSKQSILKDFHILHKIWSHPQVLHNFQTKARDQREKIKAEKLEDDLAHEDHEDIKPNETDIWWLDHLDGGTMLDCLESSNKFVVVFRILDECISLGDKMLIFSTSLFCLDALEYFLKKINNWSLGQEYYRLDGSVPAEVRQKWCREFNAENNVKTKLFLVSTRAGCLGLNMTAANRVVIMDTSWNPAHDIQSIFRVYRFGQKKDCFIYRLVAMGTMEQKIYERSVTKQAIACRVVDEQQIDRHYNSADLTELYRFDESGSSVACGVAAGVRDVALLRVACGGALHAVHEHDSLLRGSEPALPEHERRAAWAQFQQEQEHKQIQNSLGVYPPNIKIPLKRIHGHEYAKPPIISHEDVKQEVVSVAPTLAPVEPKSKRGKKVPDQKFAENVCKSMIPDKPTPVATRSTRGRPLEEVPPLTWGYGIKKKVGRKKKDPKAGTSKQAHLESIRQPVDNNIDEDAMVQQITQILVHHNFQNRGMEIANLIANVKNLVTKGEYNDAKETDELTRSIARVLMGKGRPMLQPRTVTDIMCESITNTAISSAEPEEITGDLPSPPVLIEQERPKANKNNQKLRGTGEMVRVTSGPKSKTKRKAAVEARKSIEILPQDDVINLDDDDSEDSDFETDELVETVTTPNSSVKIKTEPNKDRKTANETSINIDDTNKQPVKKYTRNPKPIISVVKTEKIVDSVKEVSKNKDEESSILLSDDDEPPISQPTPKGPATVIDEPEVDDNEEVPLPLSLLTNKNFIKIVAHTYSTGNPMLDEDAATLAAQYSTFRALKEAEQSGKPIVSGPIYDIATQILGKPILKKLQTVNVKKPPESTATVHQLQDNINAIEAFIKSEPGTSKEKMDKKEQSVKPPTVSAPNNVVPVGLIKRVQSGQNAPIPPQPSPAPARDECILPDDDECIVSDSPPRAPDPPPMVPAPRPMAPGPRPMAPAPRPTPRPSIIVRRARTIAPRPSASDPPPVVLNNYLTRNPRPRIFYTTPTASAAASVVAAVASALPQQKNVIKISQGRVGRPPLAPAPASTPPLSTASNSATICLDSDDEDIPPVALGPVPVALHAGPVPVSLVSAQTGARLPLPPMLAPKNPPRTVTSKANKFVLVPTSQLPVPTVQPEKPPELPKLPSQGTKTKARCKPGDLFRISNTGEIEVITQQQLKEEQLKEEQATRNDNTPKLVPIAPKPSTFTHKAKSKPRILKPPLAKVAQTPAQAPAPTEPRLPKPPEPKLSNPATTPSPAVKPSRSRTISSSSSSNSSRSSSPENPLSILKDVVHIQAAEEKPRISRQKPLLMKTSKAPEANVSVQHVISLDDKPTGSSSSKNNRSVIHMSDSAPPPKSKAEDRTFDKLVYSLKTDKSKPTKPAKGPTKIVGTMKNIILESGKGLTLTGTSSSKPSTSQNKKIKAIVTTPKAPETKKRPAVTADSSSIKKARKEPMTLKDFNIDDIDDIIELE